MKKRIYLSLLLILSCFAISFAQIYITPPGFLVLTSGDTIRGLLKERSKIGKQVSIKPNGSGEFKEYDIDNLRSVFYEEGYYYKPVSVSSENATEKLMLLCLAEGAMLLYKHKDHYFVEKAGTPPVKLKKQDLLEGANMKVDTHYRRQLRYLMSDCPKAQKLIGKTNFTDQHLLNLVEQYNACIDPTLKPTTYRNAIKIKFKKGVRVGVANNRMRYEEGISNSESRNYDMGATTGFMGGIFINLSYGKMLSFQPELVLIRKTGSYEGKLSGLYPLTIDIKQTWLQVPGSLYCTFPLKKLRPFLSLGGAIGFPLQNESEKNILSLQSKIGILNSEYGYRGSAGVEWELNEKNRIYLEFIYESSTIRTDFSNKNIYNKTQHISARFSF